MTREIINAERENIERIADVLLDKETIFSEDIESILGTPAQKNHCDEQTGECPEAVVEEQIEECESKTENSEN
jgi:hypothetical protein